MKPKHILAAVAGIGLTAGLFYLNRAGQTPAGQAPVQSLTAESFADLPRLFNASAGDARVLLLLSPT